MQTEKGHCIEVATSPIETVMEADIQPRACTILACFSPVTKDYIFHYDGGTLATNTARHTIACIVRVGTQDHLL